MNKKICKNIYNIVPKLKIIIQNSISNALIFYEVVVTCQKPVEQPVHEVKKTHETMKISFSFHKTMTMSH